MFHRIITISILIIFITAIAVSVNTPTNAAARGRAMMSVSKTEDATIVMTPIETLAGNTIGARVEVINHRMDKSIVMAVREELSLVIPIRIFDKDGIDIAPIPPTFSKSKSEGSPYHYEILPPSTSRCWFVAVPKEVRADVTKMSNEGNLQPISKGDYTAEVGVMFSYFLQEKGQYSIPDKPQFKTLNLKLPRIAITVDPADLSLDMLKVYTAVQ